MSGFKATGIFPLYPQAIPEEAYISSTLYVDEHDTTTHDSVDTTAVRGTTPAVDENGPTETIGVSLSPILPVDPTLDASMDDSFTTSIGTINNILLNVPIQESVTDLPLVIRPDGTLALTDMSGMNTSASISEHMEYLGRSKQMEDLARAFLQI